MVEQLQNLTVSNRYLYISRRALADPGHRPFFTGYTVVSHEVHVPGQRSEVKIPAVCQALNVPCVTAFEMLAREKLVFDLR